MAAPYLLGIDLGTTTCRCAIFDLDGTELAAAYREMPIRYPRPLWAEADPEAWWRATTLVVREALAGSGLAPDRIAGVGLSGLMHAPVLLDGAGRPLALAMLWMDQRCAPQCEALSRAVRELGPERAATPRVSTTLTAPKLRWLAEMEPAVLARARTLLLPKDFVRYRLTGTLGTDPSDAGGTGLFARARGDWDADVVRLARVPPAILPPIFPSEARAGVVTPDAARATGLAPGTAVAVGGADTLCTRLGVGELRAGEVCIYLGTAAWIALVDGAGPDGRPVVRGFGATATTGAALRWVRDLLVPPSGEAWPGTAPQPPNPGGPPGANPPRFPQNWGDLGGPAGADVAASYELVTRPAAEVAPGAEGLFFLPHLMGERGPDADPLARGALVGLTLRHGRPEMVRAVLEGTAFQLRRLLEARAAGQWPDGAGPTAGAACGGVARSPLWMQLLADVTRLPLRVPAVVEAGVLGAAILGGAAAGVLALDTAAARMVHGGRHYLPNADLAPRYDALYARYRRLDDLLAPWFRAEGAGEEERAEWTDRG